MQGLREKEKNGLKAMKLQLYNVYRRLYYWVETLAIQACKRLEIWRFSKKE